MKLSHLSRIVSIISSKGQNKLKICTLLAWRIFPLNAFESWRNENSFNNLKGISYLTKMEIFEIGFVFVFPNLRNIFPFLLPWNVRLEKEKKSSWTRKSRTHILFHTLLTFPHTHAKRRQTFHSKSYSMFFVCSSHLQILKRTR